MHLEIRYKKPFNSSFPGLTFVPPDHVSRYPKLYMERHTCNRLYLWLCSGAPHAIDFLNGWVDWHETDDEDGHDHYRLSRNGVRVMKQAHDLNGEYYFSVYQDHEDPWETPISKAHIIHLDMLGEHTRLCVGQVYRVVEKVEKQYYHSPLLVR